MSFFTSLADIDSFLSEEKLTLRHRIKLSVAKKGKPRPSSVKKRISQSMKGKSNFEGQKHTSKGKENISIGRGDYDPIKGKKWYVNKRTGKTWRKDRNPTETLYKHGRIAEFREFIKDYL